MTICTQSKDLAAFPACSAKTPSMDFSRKKARPNLFLGSLPSAYAGDVCHRVPAFGKNPLLVTWSMPCSMACWVGWFICCSWKSLAFVQIFQTIFDLVLAAAVLFLAHPVHTEAVANIKGRDEIVSMLGAITGHMAHFTASRQQGKIFFMGLAKLLPGSHVERKCHHLSCRGATNPRLFFITRLGRCPPIEFTSARRSRDFMLIRTAVLGFDLGGTPMELMNNPSSNWEAMATFLFRPVKSLQRYCIPWASTWCCCWYRIRLPMIITHDTLTSCTLHATLVSPVCLSCLAGFGGLWLPKRPVLSFGILYFLLTSALCPTLFFPSAPIWVNGFVHALLVFCLILPYIIQDF